MENHLPPLIIDLGLILGAAAVTTLIFKRLKQPLVLGYIIAGLLVGQQIKFFPSVTDEANIQTWAEIGVIFLLFSLGLEFSFKKLVRVGGAASITAFVEIVFIVVAGYFVGRWMGWKTVDCIFLGGMLASSSTTIILRAFDELGVKTKQFARVVFGVLIVEDIVVILLLVLLPTLAISQKFEGGQLGLTVLKLVFFLVLWFLTGIFLLPTFLKKVKKMLDEETTLIIAVSLCLGMVVIATQVGFSAELGAFIMGSIFAETTSAEKIEHILKPVKDLFGAIFFVSVGLMIDLHAIWEYKWPVLIITALTIAGKMMSTTIGAVMSGQPLKQSVQVGMSMAQIGEFAFIIATLGLTLGVTSSFLFPVAVGVSAITTFTTPYMIRYSEPLHNFVVKMLPPKLINRINKYSSNTQNLQATSEWKIVLRSYATIVATNAVMVIAIVLLSSNFLLPFVKGRINNYYLSVGLTLGITAAAMIPFLWAMAAKKPNNWAYKELWVNKRFNRGPLIVVEFLRVLLVVVLIGFLLDRLLSGGIAILIVIPVVVVLIFLFSRKIQQFYSRIESRFISNLNARERAAEKSQQLKSDPDSELTPWDAHLADFKVHPLAPYIATELENLSWRERYGVNIALIKRGEKYIYAPGRYEKLYPHDVISVIGTDEQLQKFRPVVEERESINPELSHNGNISLEKIIVDEHNLLKGATLRESRLRENTNGLVVGIERNGRRILNPDSNTILEWDDVIYIVGNRKKILGIGKMDNRTARL